MERDFTDDASAITGYRPTAFQERERERERDDNRPVTGVPSPQLRTARQQQQVQQQQQQQRPQQERFDDFQQLHQERAREPQDVQEERKGNYRVDVFNESGSAVQEPSLQQLPQQQQQQQQQPAALVSTAQQQMLAHASPTSGSSQPLPGQPQSNSNQSSDMSPG